MILICAVICVFSLFINVVDCRPGKHSDQEGSISTRDVRMKVDENVAALVHRLFTLESQFSGVTDPDAKEDFKSRFDSLDIEISMVSQDVYHGAMGVCLGSDTFPGDIAPCSRNPMNYITEKFTPLYKRIEDFHEEILLYLSKDKDYNKVNENPEHLLNQKVLISTRDIEKKINDIVFKVVKFFFRLEIKFSLLNNAGFREVQDRFVSFGVGIIYRYADTYEVALRMCVGRDTDPNDIPDALCYRNPMSFIEERVASLNRTIKEFEVELLLYLGEAKIPEEVNWSPEELLNRDVINNSLSGNLDKKFNKNMGNFILWYINMEYKLLRSVNPEYRVEFIRKFDTFEDEIIAELEILNQHVMECKRSDTSPGHNYTPCYQKRNEQLLETFKTIYKRLKDFEDKCRSLKRALDDGDESKLV